MRNAINRAKHWYYQDADAVISSSLKWKAPPETFDEADVLMKKQSYKIYLSMFYGFLLLITALYDIRAVYKEWEHEGIPEKWHTGILYAHVLSFYILVNGIIVCNETNQRTYTFHAVVSLLVNSAAFGLRLFYEIGFADFIPVLYFPPGG